MNYLGKLFKNKIVINKLGRWKIQYEPEIINLKINQANEDHCGCCTTIPEFKVISNKVNALICIKKPYTSIMKI